MVRRLIAAYRETSADDRAAGLKWYQRAEREAARIAESAPSGIGPVRAAAIIAALSPRTRWAENIRAAEDACVAARRASGATADLFGPDAIDAAVWAATESHGLSDPRRKAIRILRGERPADVLGGPKVRAFFANITGDHRRVTVDVWAARAAFGRWQTAIPAGRLYERLERAYQAAADACDVSPRDFQAAIWVATRGSAD